MGFPLQEIVTTQFEMSKMEWSGKRVEMKTGGRMKEGWTEGWTRERGVLSFVSCDCPKRHGDALPFYRLFLFIWTDLYTDVCCHSFHGNVFRAARWPFSSSTCKDVTSFFLPNVSASSVLNSVEPFIFLSISCNDCVLCIFAKNVKKKKPKTWKVWMYAEAFRLGRADRHTPGRQRRSSSASGCCVDVRPLTPALGVDWRRKLGTSGFNWMVRSLILG